MNTERWYYFTTARGVYVGKVETTEAEIRKLFVCSIVGNSVTVFGEVRS